jgi:hypothetical protein
MVHTALMKALVGLGTRHLNVDLYSQRPPESVVFPYSLLSFVNSFREEDTSGPILETHTLLLSCFAVATDTKSGDDVATELANQICIMLENTELFMDTGEAIQLVVDSGGLEEEPERDSKTGLIVWRAYRMLEVLVSV